jgi:hypothetical protein
MQVDSEFMAAVLLRCRQPPGANVFAHSPEALAHREDLSSLELAALWVDPTLEDRAEVTCCLLVYLQQYLLAWDPIKELHEGAVKHLVTHPRRCDGYAVCKSATHRDGAQRVVKFHQHDRLHSQTFKAPLGTPNVCWWILPQLCMPPRTPCSSTMLSWYLVA